MSYFPPVLSKVPVFGHVAADHWLWAFDLSPAYFGYGIIIGPSINLHLLLGTILGWGILSPIAKFHNWAPGDINSWEDGPRGWLIWVGLGFILGNSAVGLGWSILQPWMPWTQFRLRSYRAKDTNLSESNEGAPLLRGTQNYDHNANRLDVAPDVDWAPASLVSRNSLLRVGAVLVVVFLVVFCGIFRRFVAVWAPFVALIMIPPAAFISMRSLGETNNGASLAVGTSLSQTAIFSSWRIHAQGHLGRVAQLIIGSVVPRSNKNRFAANLLLGCAVETGASQASQHMGSLKTAYITRTPPKAIFYAQLVGSVSGICIATLVYRIYTTVMHLPNTELQSPEAHLWVVTARLVYQQGLPPFALSFSLVAFAIGIVFSALRIYGSNCWWRALVPSGVAMAIGRTRIPYLITSLLCLTLHRFLYRSSNHLAKGSRQSHPFDLSSSLQSKKLRPAVLCDRIDPWPGYFQHHYSCLGRRACIPSISKWVSFLQVSCTRQPGIEHITNP